MSFVTSKSVSRRIVDRVVRIGGICFLLIPPLEIAVSAQSDPIITIDRILRSESLALGTSLQGDLIIGVKKWLGAYQRILKQDNSYIAIFDRASIPLIVEFKDGGDFKGFTFGCPTSRSISVSQAPEAFQQALSKCNGFKF